MMPTVAELRPERRAYTMDGSLSLMLDTPMENPYIPAAPGNDHSANCSSAGTNPAWRSVME